MTGFDPRPDTVYKYRPLRLGLALLFVALGTVVVTAAIEEPAPVHANDCWQAMPWSNLSGPEEGGLPPWVMLVCSLPWSMND